jgi:hypothetical protein
MANKPDQGSKAPQGNNVAPITRKCQYEPCRLKDSRAGFCEEHYYWFKEGLITKSGEKAKDFDKKYQAFKRRQAA